MYGGVVIFSVTHDEAHKMEIKWQKEGVFIWSVIQQSFAHGGLDFVVSMGML